MENKAVSLLLRRLSALREDMTELRARARIAVNAMQSGPERDSLREHLVLLNERDARDWDKLMRFCAETESEEEQT